MGGVEVLGATIRDELWVVNGRVKIQRGGENDVGEDEEDDCEEEEEEEDDICEAASDVVAGKLRVSWHCAPPCVASQYDSMITKVRQVYSDRSFKVSSVIDSHCFSNNIYRIS